MHDFSSLEGASNDADSGVGQGSQVEKLPFQGLGSSSGGLIARRSGLIWIAPSRPEDGPGWYLNVKGLNGSRKSVVGGRAEPREGHTMTPARRAQMAVLIAES